MSSDAAHSPPLDMIELVALYGGRTDLHEGHERWWITDPDSAAEDAAGEAGLVETRRLFQMRRPLPLDPLPDVIETRAFDPDRDVDAWLAINNAAFSWHPEQGHWTAAMLEARMSEPWFDPEGFRIADVDGAMAGFCWTKVHADQDPALGEIYVVAIDPARRGTGLGSAMTVAGLDWLWTERRTPIGMLYVEHDNHAALAVYGRLGFAVESAEVAYEPADAHLPFGSA